MNILDDLFVNIGQWWTNLLAGFLPDWAVTTINGLIGGLILALLGTTMVLVLTYMERKVFARLQDRIGPNRWGPYGIFQAIADAIINLRKEDEPTESEAAAEAKAPEPVKETVPAERPVVEETVKAEEATPAEEEKTETVVEENKPAENES